jgi:diguanylate cyclase (GGDEF)-like protein
VIGGVLCAAALHAPAPARADDDCAPRELRVRLRLEAEAALAEPAPRQHQRWQALVDAQRRCGDPGAEAEALAAWSQFARGRADMPTAFAAEEARYALAVRVALDGHRAAAAARLGTMLIAHGEVDQARRRLEEARSTYERLGGIAEMAEVHSELSRLDRRVGDYLSALRQELAALDLRRRLEPPPNLWRSLLNLAVLYEQIELFDESRQRYAEALDEAERHGVEADVADALNGYSGFLNDFGGADAPQALAMAERALGIHRRLGDPARIGSCLLQVGRAQFNLGRLDAAEAAMREALTLAVDTDSRALQAHVQFRRGEIAFARGDVPTALNLIEQARLEYERQGNRHRLIKVHGVLERVHAKDGDELAAARAGREHFRLRNELLGANATGRLGELLTNFALGEERVRNERLRQENALTALRLAAERRELQAIYAIAIAVGFALLLLGWRHVTVQRLYRLLRGQSAQVEAQGEQLAAANAQLTEQSKVLLELSLTDTLTQVRNRAHGMERLGALLATFRELGRRPVLLLIDVDHFKAINDRYGHLAGDQVLVAVARTLAATLPPGAELSRIGGEEFMVLLADAERSQASLLADALRRRVRDLHIDVGPRSVQITISIGMCFAGEAREPSLRSVFAAADRALYQAKRDGRDRVCIGQDT